MSTKDEFFRGLTLATTSGLLTATGAETVYDTTATINFYIDGQLYQKAAVTDGATPTTDAVTGAAITLTASKARVVKWCLDSSGTVKVVAGPITDWNGTAFDVAPADPEVPTTLCVFATQMLKASSSAGTLTFGSSNWNATGFTNSIQNGSGRARPRTS
jgi:hypothetical protein